MFREARKINFFDILIDVVLFLFCLAIVYPLYYMLIVSVSGADAVLRGEVKLWPIDINFAAYRMVLTDSYVLQSYSNTIWYVITGTLTNMILTALCAYPLSRKHFYGRSVFSMLIIFTMFFDGGMIPNFMLVSSLGMLNTTWAIILPPAINTINMIIMRTFFEQIPDELNQAASIDGANDIVIFTSIVLPLSTPILATMVLFYAVWHWNSFFPALIYLMERSKYPMQLIMRNIVISGELGGLEDTEGAVLGLNIKYAVIYITIFPILMLYPFLQKYFVKGIMIGALKG